MKTVIEMAREAGWKDLRDYDSAMRHEFFMGNIDSLKRLVELVRADEREACAKVCDDLPAPPHVSRDDATVWDVATLDCAEAIRARSNT